MISNLSLRTLAMSVAVLALVVSHASPAAASPLENVAVGKTATSLLSLQCSAGSAPAKAVDGKVSNILTDKWCAKTLGPSRLMIDLRYSYYLFSFTLYHAGAAGENPVYNTRDFYIRTSNDLLTWKTVVNVTGNTASISSHAVQVPSYPGTHPPVLARYIELVVTRPTQMPASLLAPQVTRLFELQAVGASTCEQYCV